MADQHLRPSPISATVDFEADGVQHGFLRLPYSRDDSAWGSVMIPITVVKNGEGPTALLTGGNHGDEYEGPIALFDLARKLDPAEVRGRVIILPAMNYPAFLAQTRTSPIDKGNMNRSFPGRPDGTVTEKIADYFQRVLLPLADIVLDFHSGGRTLDFLPFCAAHILSDKAQEAKAFEFVRAFGAPYSMKMHEIDAVGMYDTAAEEMGKIFITTELGGGGSATARSAAIAKRGTANVLRHAGIIKGDVEAQSSQWLDMPGDDCFAFAEEAGLVEFMIDLGEAVERGSVIARIYPTGRTGAKPSEVSAKMDGLLVARHYPGLIKPGDCCAVLAVLV
ncbi:N(2)-acetyl-L-2,4-diaminobutanoate deacetylase DoeB [Sinorhizobium numidicum]|uniref:N(2)-acetyl-L-2,4-diaminobutanoate deacetylase DoeB n=1 Tax=Sinorhizobium numidicum TaxID=680248 RepID=A0ABY8CRX3_9HYPH|nr:N(2)-acetyl-L-2,4-diaminobutanoate deacetylase DoeB [Sinorhizobium numidicum]WEX75399.1 N(2)-acetyl-L-2,4-diaminobutanoate deacetylase DoeB [Sinorhizobium numidicum]WEX81395.1 N(2)-acetyl-L-2,4-diaminobutanoate deacetylase DoeB [Sinorhizobium numidicum]